MSQSHPPDDEDDGLTQYFRVEFGPKTTRLLNWFGIYDDFFDEDDN